jgi:hypothetical protein
MVIKQFEITIFFLYTSSEFITKVVYNKLHKDRKLLHS